MQRIDEILEDLYMPRRPSSKALEEMRTEALLLLVKVLSQIDEKLGLLMGEHGIPVSIERTPDS